MTRIWIFCGALSAAVAVAMGAAAAHALAARLSPDKLAFVTLGADYQLWHALALIAVGLISRCWRNSRLLPASGAAFLLGTVCFSGGLYNLAFGGPRLLHTIVPLGGSLFILGWILLALSALLSAKSET